MLFYSKETKRVTLFSIIYIIETIDRKDEINNGDTFECKLCRCIWALSSVLKTVINWVWKLKNKTSRARGG